MTAQKTIFVPLVTLLFLTLSYFYVDQSVALWCHENLTQSDKELFKVITQFGESHYYLITFAVTFLLFRFLWKKPLLAYYSLFLFSSVALSGIIVNIVKWTAGRYRPAELFDHDKYGFIFFEVDRATTSFPSGHTTTAFALAAAITFLWPRWSLPAWTLATLIGISRIAITAHYPSDVIGGALCGFLSVVLLIHYWKKDPKNNQL